MTGFWGNLKTEEIPDDPFSIPANTYYCQCMEAFWDEYEGQRQFKMKFVVMDRGSAFYETTINQKYDMPDPSKAFTDLTQLEQWGPKFLKLHMARGFDMTPEEIKNPDPDVHMVGKYLYVTTVLKPGSGKNSGRRYTNITDMVCERINDMENAENDELADRMGLGVGAMSDL